MNAEGFELTLSKVVDPHAGATFVLETKTIAVIPRDFKTIEEANEVYAIYDFVFSHFEFAEFRRSIHNGWYPSARK